MSEKEREALLVLKKGIISVQDLIQHSYGVAGLHLNGEVAPWGTLREGGKYEEWLIAFDDAVRLIREEGEQALDELAKQMSTKTRAYAGARWQINDYCRKNGIHPLNIVSVDNPEDLSGLRGDTLLLIGNYTMRADWQEVRMMIKERELDAIDVS